MSDEEPDEICGPGAPSGNANALLHGAYVKHLLSEDELAQFRLVVQDLYATFDLNYSSDAMVCVMCAFNFIRWQRAQLAQDERIAVRFRKEVTDLLAALKATRQLREEAVTPLKTPAEWASELLIRVRAARAAQAASEGGSPQC